MFAAVMPGLSVAAQMERLTSINPWVFWAAIALVGVVFLLERLPRRISVAASVAVIGATVANPVSTQVIFNGIECCDLYWIIYFWCWPVWLGC